MTYFVRTEYGFRCDGCATEYLTDTEEDQDIPPTWVTILGSDGATRHLCPLCQREAEEQRRYAGKLAEALREALIEEGWKPPKGSEP